jgi:hypothetical protein
MSMHCNEWRIKNVGSKRRPKIIADSKGRIWIK